MSEQHPAREAALRSRTAVMNNDKDAWIALFAEGIVLEDPIGKSPIDPEGNGLHGKDALRKLWDERMADASYGFVLHDSYVAGMECANHMTLEMALPGGMFAEVTGVFTYRVNDAGLIDSLRAHWEFDAMMATLRTEK